MRRDPGRRAESRVLGRLSLACESFFIGTRNHVFRAIRIHHAYLIAVRIGVVHRALVRHGDTAWADLILRTLRCGWLGLWSVFGVVLGSRDGHDSPGVLIRPRRLPRGLTLRLVQILRLDAVTHEHPHRSEEHTSELQSRGHLVCRLLLEKKN